MQRVQTQGWMISNQRRFERYKLPSNWVLEWVTPVCNTEDMRCQTNGHRRSFHALFDISKEVIFRLNMLELGLEVCYCGKSLW